MKRLLNILVIDSIRELIRYKSFFLLVALLILLDRLLRHYSARIQFQLIGETCSITSGWRSGPMKPFRGK